MNEQKDGAFFIIAGQYLKQVYHKSAILGVSRFRHSLLSFARLRR